MKIVRLTVQPEHLQFKANLAVLEEGERSTYSAAGRTPDEAIDYVIGHAVDSLNHRLIASIKTQIKVTF